MVITSVADAFLDDEKVENMMKIVTAAAIQKMMMQERETSAVMILAMTVTVMAAHACTMVPGALVRQST